MTNKRPTLAERKASLQEKQKKELAQINAQIRAEEAKTKDKERKKETRRKIIAGALALNHSDKNRTSEFAKKLQSLMDEYIIKDTERDLFNLSRLPEDEQTERLKKHAEERKKENALAEL